MLPMRILRSIGSEMTRASLRSRLSTLAG